MKHALTLLFSVLFALLAAGCATTGASSPSDDQVKLKLTQVCTQASAINDVLMASEGIVDQDLLDQITTIRPYVITVCSPSAGLTDLRSFAKGGVDDLLKLVPLLPIAQEKKQQALLAVALVKILTAPLAAQ